jgi:RNA polymerase sigma-70 factor (ECF subfamily)
MTMPADSDQLERARQGDRAAFEQLFRPLYGDGFRLAAAMLSDAQQAEDVMQESLLRAWRRLETFRVGADLRPWFLTIVANQCRSLLRSRWWSVIRIAELQSPAPEEPPLVERFDLHAALRRLPPAARLLLVLHYYLDLSFDDMARVVGASPSAVKARTHRALERLRIEWKTVEVVS